MNVIAIDSGGTKIVGAVVDEEGNILEKKRHKNEGHSGDFLVETYKDIILEYKKKYKIESVGLGVNGRIDIVNGVVKDCTRYTNYEGRHLREELESASNIPVSLNNDCYVGVYGEIWKGAAQGYPAVTGIMLGTGVGGAIYENGRFLHGGHFGAGELGHQILHRNGIPCFCGQAGCVERYVSGTALWEQYNLKIGMRAISSGYEFFDLLHGGDEAAKAVLDTFVNDLGYVMVNIANLCDPSAFLIGGGLADTRAVWAETLQERYESYAGPYLRKTPIIYASRGNDAALLGAAKFAFDMLSE